jgi:para-aminobenzoate synthetase component 1
MNLTRDMHKASLPRLLSLDLSPTDVAARLRHLGGLVFLDSGMGRQQHSIIAARPHDLLCGNIHNADGRRILREALARGGVGPVDSGLPAGGLFGAVEFDGQFQFGAYRDLLIFRHDTWEWFALGNDLSHEFREPVERPAPTEKIAFRQEMTRESYIATVSRAKEYIAAGDIYQVNLAQRFSADWDEGRDAFQLYERLRDVSPAPFAAFLEMCGRTVISSSPELFLKISGRGIRTRPIKGTRPRFSDPDADEKSAYDLITSQKEIAELIMITDLERNDLGQVCDFGSIHATDLLKLERFPQVFHLVSTIDGRLRADVDHVEALRRCSPGGSISGAPKKRAREIIAELEPGTRGLYTGSIGYLGYNGESQFNIAIRTAVIEDGQLHFHTGAGIVADSDPAMEYEETLHKAAGILASASTRSGRV